MNYSFAFLRRTFGPRGAVVIFVIVVSALYFHSKIGEVVSDLHAQIVEWRPLPQAKPDVFTVALARLETTMKNATWNPPLRKTCET